MGNQAIFAGEKSIAAAITDLLRGTRHSVDAALYRLNLPTLAEALRQASQRGIRIRLLLDRAKFEETIATQRLLAQAPFEFRLLCGPRGPGSKMHHKFAILDKQVVLTGSYNWTLESEEQNYENLVILGEPSLTNAYQREFDQMWKKGKVAHTHLPAREQNQETIRGR